MPKPLKIALIGLCAAAIAFGIVAVISYIPRHVQREFSGIELLVTGENEYEILQTLYIRIDGRVRHGMFAASPMFDGAIEVSAYDFTLDNPNLGITFLDGFASGAPMFYPVLLHIDGSPVTRIETLGWIYTDANFSSLVIQITEWIARIGGGSSGSYYGRTTNRIIAAPAANASDALELLDAYGFAWSDELGVVHRPLQ